MVDNMPEKKESAKEKNEKANEKANEQTLTIKFPKVNMWMIFTGILAVLVVALTWQIYAGGVTGIGGITGMTTALNSQQAATKAIDYINKNLVTTGTATLASVEESNGMYKVTTSYQGQNIPIFVTKDGKLLFASSPIDMTQAINKTTSTQTQTEIPKTDKASAELYVMAFCPYGMQAETLMKPVFDLLGTKADIKIRFIANVGGTTADSVQSLHGAVEAAEDLRQVCIMKNYDQTTYWKYVTEINANCASKYSDVTAYDTCWKAAATKFGIDVAKIDACSKGSEGLDLLKADEALTTQYGVSGSPTLIINGVTYTGERSSEGFKQAICSGFTTQPAECSQTLAAASSSSTAAAGGCG